MSELKRENQEIKDIPKEEKKEIYDIYYKKGFRGNLLNQIVKKIVSNKKLWLKTMMEDELNLSKKDYEHPLKDTLIVGLSAIIGSLIPLLPFLFFPVITGIYVSLGLAAFTLFITGMIKAKLTVGNQIKSGLEMLIIGMLAALIGYLIGSIFGNINF